MAKGVLTTIGKEKTLKARAGLITLPTIAGMVFGNDGVESDGTPKIPGTDGLFHEIFRKEIDGDGIEQITETCIRYTCTLAKQDLADEAINEIGLYDSDGDIFCVKTHRRKEKDSDSEMIFSLDDQF